MKKEKLSLITIFMYSLSILLLLFTIYRFYGAMTYIASLVAEKDFIVSENIQTVIFYYYEQCASPFIFSVILYVLGEINEKLKLLLVVKQQEMGNKEELNLIDEADSLGK